MKEYICINPCFHMGKLWKTGETARFSDKDVPRTKGKLRHFELVVKDEPAVKKAKKEEE